MRVLLIQNPDAGYNAPSAAALVAAFERHGHEVTYRSGDDHWKPLLGSAWQDVVVVAGGDGTVAPVAKALSGNPLPMTILPAGTANNIAGSLGIKGNFLNLIANLKDATERTLDIGEAAGAWGTKPFVESVGLGLMVDMMSHFERKTDDGQVFASREQELYQARHELRTALRHMPPVSRQVFVDDKDFSGNYLLVEVLNLPRIGPEVRLAPRAESGDRQLNVVLLRDEDRGKLDERLEDGRAIRDRSDAPWKVLPANQVTIRACGDQIHIDDARWPEDHEPAPEQEITLRLKEKSVRVLVPQPPPQN